jgi:hypothetical protein
MVAKVHISHSCDDYFNAACGPKQGCVDAARNFLSKIKKATILFKGIRCGMKWGDYFSPNDRVHAALKDGSREIKQMTSPLVFPSTAKATYKLYLSVNEFRHAIQKDQEDLQTAHKIEKAAKKVFLNGAKWLNKTCGMINLLNEIHVVETKEWGKYVSGAIGNTAFVTSAISSVSSFKNTYFKFENEKGKNNDTIVDLARSALGLASTFFSGIGLYFSAFVPAIVCQGISTVSVMISVSQYFNHRDQESRYFHSRFVPIYD